MSRANIAIESSERATKVTLGLFCCSFAKELQKSGGGVETVGEITGKRRCGIEGAENDSL